MSFHTGFQRLTLEQLRAMDAIAGHVWTRRMDLDREPSNGLVYCMRCGVSRTAARHFGWKCDHSIHVTQACELEGK